MSAGARRAIGGLVVVLLAVIAAETMMLRQQSTLAAATRVRSDLARSAFLLGDTTAVPVGADVYIRLRNVRFKWSDKVYIDAGDMAVRAAPMNGTTVDFDDLESFRLNLQESVVLIRPDVLAGMFNENIFNYSGSRVHGLKVAVVKDDHGTWIVRIDGRLGLIVTIPFTMFTHLDVDTTTNNLVIEVDHLKVFGIIPATKLVRWTPLSLDRLVALPANPNMMIDRNRFLVKPFGLFPPPRIDGRMTHVDVGENAIRITFAGGELAAPKSAARNYVFMRGGTSKFGHFRMADTNVLILDQDSSNPFVFSLLHYADMIPRSTVTLANTKSVCLTMPDYSPAAASPVR